jgi:hypothetical protein
LISDPVASTEKNGSIAEGVKAGEHLASRQLGLQNIDPILSTKTDPCMPFAVSACGADHKPSAVTQPQELPASLEGKILAIASPSLLELLGRHPVISDAKLRLVGNVSARCQESADLIYVPAHDLERLGEK